MGSVQKKKIDWAVFVPPIIMIITFCLWIVFDPKGAGIALNKAYSFVTVTLGWFFEWYAVVLFGLFIYFVVGPYSKKKLGEGDPEFKTSTWWGMMFTTNAGVGVLFWATMESFGPSRLDLLDRSLYHLKLPVGRWPIRCFIGVLWLGACTPFSD